MARDPLSWSLDDEKRRRGASGPSRNRPLTPAEIALQTPYDPRPRRSLKRDIVEGYDVAGIPGAIAGAAAQRPVAARPAPPSQPTFDNVQSGATATQTDLRDPRLGLTRIVQTAPGVFTDAPGAQGDVRYYDRTGSRADTNAPTGITANTSVRDYNRAEAATAMDMTDPVNQMEVADRGSRGLARSAAMGQEALARAAFTAEMQMTPEQRTERDLRAMQEAGLDRRSQAEISAQLSIAGAEQGTAQQKAAIDAAKVLRERQIYERQLMREDPQAFAMEQLALLENLPPEERMARLANPDDEVGGALRAAVRRAAADKLGANFTPGQASRSLIRSYDANNNPWYMPDTRFDPGDIIPGLTDEDFEVLMGADQTAYERR